MQLASSILEYYFPNSESQKRRTSSDQENGPTPPGSTGATPSKMIQYEVFVTTNESSNR